MIFPPPPPRDIRRSRAAWLICSLAFIVLAVACEIESGELPPRIAVAPTSTSNPMETPAPTATPEITFTPAPDETATPPTPAPEPTSEPTPHHEPTPANTPASEPTYEPTPHPEPTYEPTPAPEPTPYRTPDSESSALTPAGSTVVTDSGLALTIMSFTPDDDQHRFIARLRLQNVGADADSPINIRDGFNLYPIDSSSIPLAWEIGEEVGCDGFHDYFIDRHAALFPGGMVERDYCFEVWESETDDIVLVYDARGHYEQRFLALANPDGAEPARVVDARREPHPGQAAGRSRFNPVPPGRYVESADGLLALTIASADMDADWSALAESPYYYEPDEDGPDQLAAGNRLVAARVRVQNVGGDVNSALFIEDWRFTIVGSSAIEFFGVHCRATSEDPALFLGGIAEINVCFEVPESETDLALIHTAPDPPRRSGRIKPPRLEEPRRWLAFGNPYTVEAARVVDAPTPTSSGQASGRFRSDPAPPGASVYDRFGFAVSIVSANLDAADEILQYDPSNAPPGEGMRFVMARVRVEWVGGNASDFTPFDFYQFALVGSSAVVFRPYDDFHPHDNTCGAVPDILNLTLSGGEAGEGNVCFEIPQSETGLILIYGHEENARFLRLPEG